MSNRYRFDLESGENVIPDKTGVAADDSETATEEALIALKELRDSGELPVFDEQWTLVIRDEDGTEVKRIPV